MSQPARERTTAYSSRATVERARAVLALAGGDEARLLLGRDRLQDRPPFLLLDARAGDEDRTFHGGRRLAHPRRTLAEALEVLTGREGDHAVDELGPRPGHVQDERGGIGAAPGDQRRRLLPLAERIVLADVLERADHVRDGVEVGGGPAADLGVARRHVADAAAAAAAAQVHRHAAEAQLAQARDHGAVLAAARAGLVEEDQDRAPGPGLGREVVGGDLDPVGGGDAEPLELRAGARSSVLRRAGEEQGD